MEWLVLIVLILIGFILLILEFLVFPGVNVVGLIGFACLCFGIYLGYQFFGTKTGHFVVLGTALGGSLVTWYALRSQTWKRLSLESQIDGTVEPVDATIKPGDSGVCIGRLAPMGKVRVGESVVEALSEDGYVDANSKVEVVKVYRDKIVVKLKDSQHG